MMRTSGPTSERDRLLADLEGLWRALDELFASLGQGDWARRHGPHWTFADVPYHLSYFDRDTIAVPIERAGDVPDDVLRSIPRTPRELNAWNARKFAERPPGQAPERSLTEMRESRDAVRRAVAGLSDADLDRPAFVPLLCVGWGTVRGALKGLIGHTWNHVHQLRLHLKRKTPLPSASATHQALSSYTWVLGTFVDPQEAAKAPFTLVMEFTGPGGGAWTLRVEGGTWAVEEERAARADLVMTQTPETFVKTLAGMHNPMLAMLTRRIQVRGFRNLGRFSKLVPPPKLDTVVEPVMTPPSR